MRLLVLCLVSYPDRRGLGEDQWRLLAACLCAQGTMHGKYYVTLDTEGTFSDVSELARSALSMVC